MRKKKFAVLRLLADASEIDAACRALLQCGFCPQFDSETPAASYGAERGDGGENPYAAARSRLQFVLHTAGQAPLPADMFADLPGDWREKTDALYRTCRALQTEKTQLQEQAEACVQGQKKLELFGDLPVDLQDVAECAFIRVRFGHLPAESYRRMQALYGDDPYVEFFPSFFDRDEIYGMYFAPRDRAERIDAIFASMLFEPIAIPSLSGRTAQIGVEFERSLQILETELADVGRRLDAFFAREKETACALYAALAGAETLLALRAYATRCKDAYILTGLLPADRLQALLDALAPCRSVYVVQTGSVRQRPATA